MKEPVNTNQKQWKATHLSQAVQKAQAAGMKKGDKFKIGDKEYTIQDAEDLLQKSMTEKAKPRLFRYGQRWR